MIKQPQIQQSQITTIIVEDSRLARVELLSQLKQIDYIDCVGEATSLADAKALITEHDIDLVLLDIDLPDGNGFELLTQFAVAPSVIFTTAYEEYAIKAFENNAIDYLLKPITEQRLKTACDKVLANHVATTEKMQLDSTFFVKDGMNCWLVKLGNVERFQAQGNYCQVFFDDKKPMIYRSLTKVASRLPDKHFFRANRSTIVRLDAITSIQQCSSGGLELMMKSGVPVEVSRRQSSLFRQLFAL